MSRRALVRCVAIGMVLAVSGAAFLAWRAHERASIALAGVPQVPDLSRWPAGFAREVRRASAALRENGDLVEPLSRLAGLYYANVYSAQAAQAYTALHQLEPQNPRWIYLLADVRLREGEWDAAERALRKTVELDPGYLPAWFRLAEVLAKRGAIDEARECYARAVAAAPGDALAAYFQIAFEATYGDADAARERLAELVRVNPDFPALHAALSDMHAQRGDLESAERERALASTTDRALIQRDPWVDELTEWSFDINRLSVLAVEATRERRFEVAERLLVRGILIAPFEPSLWKYLISVYREAGRPEDALRMSEFALAVIPDDPDLHARQSELLCDRGRPQEAISRLRPALQRWPERASLHAALGVALGMIGRPEAAASALREAVRLDPTRVETQLHLGISLNELGRFDAAREAAQRALAARPHFSEAAALLASLALRSADRVAAESAVDRFLRLSPGADARSLVAALAPYLRFEPANADAYLLLGDLLRRAGRTDDARAIFRRGLQMSRSDGRSDQALRFQEALGRTRDGAVRDRSADR